MTKKVFEGHYLREELFPQYQITPAAYEEFCGGEDGLFINDNDGKIYIFENKQVQRQSLITVCNSWAEVSEYYEEMAALYAAECTE